MPIIKKSTALDIDRPTGAQHAVFADITPIYRSVNKQDGSVKDQMIVTWQLAGTYTDGDGRLKRFMHSEFVTPSMHKKSKLRAWLNGVTGREIADAEIPDNFDTNVLLGKNCTLFLLKTEDGFTKLQTISAPQQGLPKLVVEGYVRPAWIDDHTAKMNKETEAVQRATANVANAAAAVQPGTMDSLFAQPAVATPVATPISTPVASAPVVAKTAVPAAGRTLDDILATI